MPHYVHPKIDGNWMGLSFSCTEEPGAKCKIICPPDPRGPYYSCEEFRAETIGGEVWHVGWSEEADAEVPLHKMIPTDRCGILEWDCLDEGYCGPAGPLREGEIAFIWNGDCYEWEYVTEDAS
jgi:hypothetical protein